MKTSTRPLSLKDLSPETIAALSAERGEPAWLSAARAEAFIQFATMPWPDKRNEHWKRTELELVDWEGLQLDLSWPGALDKAALLSAFPVEEEKAPGENEAVFYSDLSEGTALKLPETLKEKPVEWIPLEAALQVHSDRLRDAWGAAISKAAKNKFLSLTLALANAGWCLVVPKGQVLKSPLRSTTTIGKSTTAKFPLNFVFVDEAAELHLWEDLVSESEPALDAPISLVSSFTSIHLKENARISCYSLQNWNRRTVHLHFQETSQGSFSKFNAIAVSMGGRVFHNEMEIGLQGQGAENKVLGVLFGDGNQNFCNWITQNHTGQRTTSDIQYRGALKGSAKSFFSGMVFIDKPAQKSDAYQSAKCLLLSKDAKADAIPNLEILADDVKCSHGAAVGPVDEDQKFYLRTRGIDPEMAERMIVQGFLEPVIAEVPSPAFQERLRNFVEDKLNRA